MAHYTVRSSSSQNQTVFRICGYSLIALMLFFLGLSQTSWINDRRSHALGWIAASLLAVGLIGVLILIFNDNMNNIWQKVSFDVAENKVVRVMEGQAPIEFPLNEISFIGESRSGLIVRGGKPLKGFFIPRAVEEYEQLKGQLSDHCKIVPIAPNNSFFLMILVIALYVLLLNAKTRSLVMVTGGIALLLQGWIIFGMRDTWAKARLPKLVMSAFILSWLFLLWLVYWRFSSTL